MKKSRRNNLLLLFVLLFISGYSWSQSYKQTTQGVRLTTQGLDLEIQFYTPDIVRILKSPSGTSFEKKSLSVIKSPEAIQLKIDHKNSNISVKSSSLLVKIDQETGQISFYTSSDKLLFSEKKEGSSFFTPVKNGTGLSYSVHQSFQLDADEAIYGLGQHQEGSMNQRNQKIVLKQNNTQVSIPFFQSVKGYGLFWDNYSTTIFQDTLNIASFNSEVGNCADYYFINGGNADKVIAGMRLLTGQSPMYPKWAFGYWQSRERYKSQEETVGVVEKYRALKVPLDGIVQDWQYWGADNRLWNSTEFGNPLFPNPQGMINRIHELNAHIIISVWPDFGDKTRIFQVMKQEGYLYNFTTWPVTPDVQVYDPFNPGARNLLWSYMNENLFSKGIDGWWLDSTEPDHLNPKEADENTKTYLGTYRQVRNGFPLVHTGGVYDKQRQVTSDKRVFILARSAFAGQQRYGTTVWSGDVQSSWDVLRKQISGGLNLSLSAIPYWNTDIGGFFSSGNYPKGVKDPAFQELYVRWLQFSTFCTMMRSHGTDTPREIYQFGEKGTWAFDAIDKYINLRYRFLPYNYSNAWNITSKSGTMMRALNMDFAGDKKCWDINNEYMFGSSLLVCPVTTPLYTRQSTNETTVDFKEIKTQEVYLPQGNDWFDFWTNKKLIGGQQIEKETPIDILPLFVKAGSIIPMGPAVQYATEKTDPIEIRIYPGANASFNLYEDENDNYNYEKGAYSVISFKWDNKSKELQINNRKGSFKGMQQNRTFEIVLVSDKKEKGTQNGNKNKKTISYTGKKMEIRF